jgi:hypothetical protein
VSFAGTDADPQLGDVRRALANMGRPLARVQTRHEFRDNGTADLAITIEDEGPAAVVGRIKVLGGSANSPAEIIKAAGLAPGSPFTPDTLDRATVALWNTGRFFPFALTAWPRGPGSQEIDLIVRVREIAGVPPLKAGLPAEADAARRFIIDLNRWLATGDFTDFVFTAETGQPAQMVFGMSARDGMILELRSGAARHLCAALSSAGLLLDIQSADQRGGGRLPLAGANLVASIVLLPSSANDGKMEFYVKGGLSSLARSRDRLAIDLVVSPAWPLLKPDHFRREGDQVVVSMDGKTALLSLDLVTALPVPGKTTTFESRDGIVRERQQALDAAGVGEAGAPAFAGWLDLARAAAGWSGLMDGIGPADADVLDDWLGFAGALLSAETIRPFKELFAKWKEGAAEGEDFMIPQDPALWSGGGSMMNLLVGVGALSLADVLAPPDSWPSRLARELVFLSGGKSQYTAATLDELLADPGMGPCGALLCAGFLEKFDPAAARRFVEKAGGRADAAGFRCDWQLLLDPRTGLGGAMEEFLAALAALEPERAEAIAANLGGEPAVWFRGLLARLRDRPAGQDPAVWIAPHMDELWERLVGPQVRKQIDARLHPAFDMAQVAAVVNGQPVPWILVRAIANRYISAAPLDVPAPHPDRAWTSDPAMAHAVRMALLGQECARRGVQIDPARTEAVFKANFGHLDGQPEPEWLATTNMTREEARQLVLIQVAHATALAAVGQSLPPATAAQVADFQRDHGAQLARAGHFHMVQTRPAQRLSLDQAGRATRLSNQVMEALGQGLPLGLLQAAIAVNSGAGLGLSCDRDVNLLLLPPPMARALAALPAGGTTGPMLTGAGLVNIAVEEWNDAAPQPPADMQTRMEAHCLHARLAAELNRICEGLEAGAVVELPGAPPLPAPPAPVFAEMTAADPTSAVARVGLFWQQAAAGEEQANAALEEVLKATVLEPPLLVELADALLARDRVPLAGRCVKEALRQDPEATRTLITRAAARHRAAGNPARQKQLEQLAAPGGG